MLKNVIIGIIVVLVLSVIVLGWDKTVSYLEGAKEHANTELDDNVPMEFEGSRIRALIKKQNEHIFEYEEKIGDLEGRRDSARRKVESAQKEFEHEMATLKKIKALLDHKQETYTIAGNTYTFAEVNNDALARLRDVNTLKENITFHESLVKDLDGAIKQGRANLSQSHKDLAQLNTKLESLKARNINADIRIEIASLTNSIEGSPLVADTELEKAFRNYERRVNQKESRATSRLNSGKKNYRIDYDAAFVTEDAATEIDKFLGLPLSEDEGAPSSSLNKISVADALKETE